MWRVKAALGRVFHRWPVTGPSPSLRLPPSHCAEDDRLNPLALGPSHLPLKSSATDPQNGEERERRRDEEEQRARFYSKSLPRFSGLDAVGWGAAAVVLLQFVRHLHRQFCHHSGPQDSDTGLRVRIADFVASALTPDRIKISRCILPPSVGRNTISSSVLPCSACIDSSTPADGAAVLFQTSQENFNTIEQDDPLFKEITEHSEYSATEGSSQQPHLQREEPGSEEALNQAASYLQGTAESSTSHILNIMGIENVKAKEDEMAFSCFMLAAQQGYSKAQYNVGVCYNLGRGTAKDTEKAALYYSQAAAQGHAMAQYRWARYLLEAKPARDVRDTQRAIKQLEKAAKSGLREAQAYLGVFYTNEPHRDLQQAVRHFTMASSSGDAASLYHLGICCQEGWGVPKDHRRAVDLYEQAAALGHPDAQCALGVFHQKGLGGLPVNLWKALALYQKAVRGGSKEAAHNLWLLTTELQAREGLTTARDSDPLRCVMSSPCLHARGTLRAPLPQQRASETDAGSLPLDAPLTPLHHSWSTGCLLASPLSSGGLRVSANPSETGCHVLFPRDRHTFLVGVG
ncbi:death ligand signal enhancer [Mobula birostris]|uniref:death ligand signal enhancer n=1 Tax=Mobula birostris TaxID=1983395 RepID=UPI003B281F98